MAHPPHFFEVRPLGPEPASLPLFHHQKLRPDKDEQTKFAEWAVSRCFETILL
jgi:hypothetical protein